MEECRIENLFNLEQTIAKDIFEGVTYPWEVLPKIEEFIISLGKTLDKNEYEEIIKLCKSGFTYIDKKTTIDTYNTRPFCIPPEEYPNTFKTRESNIIKKIKNKK